MNYLNIFLIEETARKTASSINNNFRDKWFFLLMLSHAKYLMCSISETFQFSIYLLNYAELVDDKLKSIKSQIRSINEKLINFYILVESWLHIIFRIITSASIKFGIYYLRCLKLLYVCTINTSHLKLYLSL